MSLKVTVIDSLETVDSVWPTASTWEVRNLVGADIGLAGAAPLDAEAVKNVLPTLGRLNYQVYVTVNDRVGYLYVNYHGFKFQRGTEQVQMKAAEDRRREAQKVADQFLKQAADFAKTVEKCRERVGKEQEDALDLGQVKGIVMEWPNVLDFTYGPANDPLTGDYIDQGSFVVTFMPVIFTNGARRGGGGMPEDAFMVSTPIRLSVSEAGSINSLGSKTNSNYHTQHPHIKVGGVCLGNLEQAIQGPLQENNVVAMVDLMREWRISEAGHAYEENWASRSASWWSWFTKQKGNEVRDRFLFNGQWDGLTVQLSAPRPTFTTIEEFYGGSMEAFNHVASALGGDYTKWPTKTFVKAYDESRDKATTACTFCQKPATGCLCHGMICSGCRLAMVSCSCPVKFDEPTVVEFKVNEVRYEHQQKHPRWRQHLTEVTAGQRRANNCDANAIDPAHPAVWRRVAVSRPSHICQEHLNKGAKEAYAVALKKATDEFTPTEEGVVTG